MYAIIGNMLRTCASCAQSAQMSRKMRSKPKGLAVGECGLDYNRNFSSKEDQLYAFKEQVKLAVELNKSIFVHEREAHADLIKVLDEVKQEDTNIVDLPPIVVHCFTGEKEEALAYIDRGYYIGLYNLQKRKRSTAA